MALCDLCLTVPFSALPRLPQEHRSVTRVADHAENTHLFFMAGDEIASPTAELPDPIGFPFHENLRALELSAKSCPLCHIAQIGARAWIDRLEDAAKNNKSFIEFHKGRDTVPTEERLWLTACDDGKQGFYLWVKSPNIAHGLYLLAAVRFCVESTSPLAGEFPVRPLERDSASEASLEFVASWLQECAIEHKSGICSEESTTLPTRILDIGSQGDVIKLVDGIHQSGKYASLSYCWGKSPPYLTSRDNMEARRVGFNIHEMPQTFIDAIIIARRLGLRYLWIDSLCICQDDASDWARESARMIDVYSNAHVVIAANRSDDCTGGCFHSRAARPSSVFRLPGGSDDVTAILLFASDQESAFSGGDFRDEPLVSRGWALQERVLGKRVVHYNSRQVYFECARGIVAEDGSGLSKKRRGYHQRPVATMNPLNDDKQNLSSWNLLVWNYGGRRLSKPTDKLPAMSGLARLFHGRIGGDYVAGLWSKALMEGLAWQPLGRRGPASRDQYTGPSWSWASFDGIAATGLNPGWVDVADIVEWHVDLKHEANPFGEVENAWVRIRGPVVPLRHSTQESNEHEARLGRAGLRPLPRVCTPHTDSENGLIMTPDHTDITSTSEWKDWRLEVLLLGGYEEKWGQESCSDDEDTSTAIGSFYGLVVTGVGDEHTEKRRRVGFMFVDGKEGSIIRDDEKNWKTVTLV